MKKSLIALLFVVSAILVTTFCIDNGSQFKATNIEREDFAVSKISDEEENELNFQISQNQDFCIFNCYNPVYTADGWEKNNTESKASIVGDVVQIGYVSWWNGTLHDVSATQDDVDFYQVTLTVDRQLQVELQNIPSGTNYELRLYRLTYGGFLNLTKIYTEIGYSTNYSNLNELILTSDIQPSGKYIIKVYSSSGLSSSPYTIYLTAKMPNEYLSYSFYDSSTSSFRYRTVEWTLNDSQSKNLLDIFGCGSFASKVTFIPSAIVNHIVNYAVNPDLIFESGNTFLGFYNENELLSFLANNPEFAIVVGLAAVKWGGTFVGVAAAIFYYCISKFEQWVIQNDRQAFVDCIDLAYSSSKGMYIMNVTSITRVYMEDGSSFPMTLYGYGVGLLINQTNAYRQLSKDISSSYYIDQFGDVSQGRPL